MKQMKTFALALVASLSLASCATVGVPAETTAGKLYVAQSSYQIALKGVVAYAERPDASKNIVLTAKSVNDNVRPAFKYAQAFVVCNGDPKSPDVIIAASTIKCGTFSFTNVAAASATNLLKSATSALLGLLGKKG